MRILLVGEYSRLHLSLAEGLRALGHEVLVASDGDGHKGFPRDIDLTRRSSGLIDTLAAFWRIRCQIKLLKDFDVVQIINPCFTTLSIGVNRYLFNLLKKQNKKIFLGAFGDDAYWVRACKENKIFKYSEFFVDGESTNLVYNKLLEKRWIGTSRERLNTYVANEVDGIVACLYEYYKSYEPYYSSKLRYIPLPIHVSGISFEEIKETPDKIKFFIGIDSIRSEYKGTDVMEKVLLDFAANNKDVVEVISVESVSYEEYEKLMCESHVLLDQLYSLSPSVNPLQAMAQGKVVVSGGEAEIYELMGAELDNRPVINVYPTEKGVWDALNYILANREKFPEWSRQGRKFVEQYHDAVVIAQEYIDFWSAPSILANGEE